MIKRFQLFLGPQRTQMLFLLLMVTGLGNLLLNALINDITWIRDAQTALVLVFLAGSTIIIGGKLDSFDRGRWAAILAPAVGAILIGIYVIPEGLGLILGAAIGWILAGMFLFKLRGPMEYQQAVRFLRKNEYADAVQVLDNLIKVEPDRSNHYRFRAEILRLWGKLDRAHQDYQRMLEISSDDSARALAYNGLAEVLLQSRQYEKACEAAMEAYQLAPNEWVAAYNLGMIEDRLERSADAVGHLDLALEAKVPDARHRLLIHFYRARAYARLGDLGAAREAVSDLKQHGGGLNEWQVILQSDQAETLRVVLEKDIQQAQALANDELTVKDLT